ncbi:unnamed protein product [Camellia sinensis]
MFLLKEEEEKKMDRFIWLIQILLYLMQYQVGCLSSLSTFSSTHHSCPHDQRSALLQFKQHFTINSSASVLCNNDNGVLPYPKTLSWNESASDCCSWDGVTCDGLTGQVTGLNLGSSQLYGTIHSNSSLYHLSHLKVLDLSCNDFNYSHISSRIGSFASLTHLNLSFSKFSGLIPSEISHLSKLVSFDIYSLDDGLLSLETHTFRILLKNLTQLQKLELFHVNICSSLPDSIGHLKFLRYLGLSHCKLLGSIPKSLGNLTQIAHLDLSWNSFSGQVPSTLSNLQPEGEIPDVFGKLINLKFLLLGENNFNGQFPCWVTNMTQLLVLDVSSNVLTGPIPQSISKLVNLVNLNLSYNNFSGVELHVFLNLKKLELLDLSSNNLSVRAGNNTNRTLPNLSTLHLSSCNMNEFPDFLRNSKNLQTLDLSDGPIPKWVGQVLFFLDLSHNCLQGPLSVPPLAVSYFFISQNKLIGDIPLSICNSSSLKILDLSHNNMSGVIPQCLGNSTLSVLDLRVNGFHGTIPTFAKGNRLRNLNLNGNHLEGELPRSLANCRHMEILDLGNNKLNDTFPYWLDSLPKLQVLILKSNRFHGPINSSRTIDPFCMLRIIDISHNEFTGFLPARYLQNFKAMRNVDGNTMTLKYMGQNYCRDSVKIVTKGLNIELLNILYFFTAIDFSDNKFKGEIPNVIGRLQALRLLNLSHNCLTSHIPSLMGNLSMLESLDLSSNQLYGEIPGQLTSLPFLAVLNLSKNHLVGPIPQGKQFDTFQNDSYVGNMGLCGLPLSRECGDSTAEVQPPLVFQHEDDADFGGGFTWKAMLMGYGCGMPLGLVMAYVMFWKTNMVTRIIEGEQQIGYKWGGGRNHQT